MTHHGAGLRRLGVQDEIIRRLRDDYKSLELSKQDRAMLDYAAKLSVAPAHMSEKDVQKLRAVGFSDAGILDICQVTAYYAFVNRIANGLGVELEPYWHLEDNA